MRVFRDDTNLDATPDLWLFWPKPPKICTSKPGGNGDGIDDVIIGAPGADPNGNSRAGESYVVFGTKTGFPAAINLFDLNGSNGFVINGIDAGDRLGGFFGISDAGDVNGDGVKDVVIGAFAADPNGQSGAGESYVVFGTATGFPSALNLSDLDGSNGFVINGIDAGDLSGRGVSGAGDINGDGVGDVIIGAVRAGQNGGGESYVVFGSPRSASGCPDRMAL